MRAQQGRDPSQHQHGPDETGRQAGAGGKGQDRHAGQDQDGRGMHRALKEKCLSRRLGIFRMNLGQALQRFQRDRRQRLRRWRVGTKRGRNGWQSSDERHGAPQRQSASSAIVLNNRLI